MSDYQKFLQQKSQLCLDAGFEPRTVPAHLYDFQAHLFEWAVRKGRAAIFADCGLGKSPIQLAWADAVVQETNRPVLVLTPLAVAQQLIREAEKFGVEAIRSKDGKVPAGARIVVTNYERLEHFDSGGFAGAVCDESSILKNFSGVRRAQVTEFMRTLRYRLLCTATAAPNDFTELGTSSEALGGLTRPEMLVRFFTHDGGETSKWRLKGHARRKRFWEWVCSWARACRKPSDLGFDDARFILPELTEQVHLVAAQSAPEGMLFEVPAVGLQDQREERRRTIRERCEKVAELVDHGEKALAWCHLNAEGDLLAELIPDAVQVAGSDGDDKKEEALVAFATGDLRVLVTKPRIGAWGLNLQRCAHVTFFPSHSYEQYYQGVRRCWRFGQTRPVKVDLICTAGDQRVVASLRQKSRQSDEMFGSLVEHMHSELVVQRSRATILGEEVSSPQWLA